MKRYSPPLLLCRFIGSILPVTYNDFLLGDLIEEYAIRLETTSQLAACLWFLSQTCRSLPSMVWSLLRRDWLIRIRTAIVVYLGMAMLKIAAGLVISKAFAPRQTAHVIIGPILFLITAAIGGFAVARIREEATIFLALFVIVSVVTSIALNICPIPVPWWYQFGFLTLGPLMVLMVPAAVRSIKPAAGRPAL
ncbi:MAG TPA: hypothetical protein VFC63_13765 [Blastocatellia bacterium]|nr:hypothetical protein [Blastocatellia bacterium]